MSAPGHASSGLVIAPAAPSDMAEAGRVHAEAWRASHSAFCSPDFVAEHTAERQARYLSDKVARGGALYLLRLRGEAVGVVTVTGSLIEDLYIRPDHQREGLGTELLRHALRQTEGTPRLWILENNAGAERLYRRLGFAPTGRKSRISGSLCEIEFALTRTE